MLVIEHPLEQQLYLERIGTDKTAFVKLLLFLQDRLVDICSIKIANGLLSMFIFGKFKDFGLNTNIYFLLGRKQEINVFCCKCNEKMSEVSAA